MSTIQLLPSGWRSSLPRWGRQWAMSHPVPPSADLHNQQELVSQVENVNQLREGWQKPANLLLSSSISTSFHVSCFHSRGESFQRLQQSNDVLYAWSIEDFMASFPNPDMFICQTGSPSKATPLASKKFQWHEKLQNLTSRERPLTRVAVPSGDLRDTDWSSRRGVELEGATSSKLIFPTSARACSAASEPCVFCDIMGEVP